MTILKH